MKKQLITAWNVSLFACVLALCSQTLLAQPIAKAPVPTPQQMAWQQMEVYAFLHFSINTYTDQEWGFGNEAAQLFNPTKLDARQWARTCKATGMKGIILTAKHHCGFCLWPTATTAYSVKSAPWKDGQGDVVRELAEACREEGLQLGIYVSPWDRNAACYGKPEYIDMFRQQLRELLDGRYGDIFEVWFDGANGGTGWYDGANERRQIDHRTYYQWPETYRLVRQWQPNIVIWGDNATLADLRWVGTEGGYVGQPNWSLLPTDRPLDYELRHHGDENGTVWVPGEVNTSIRPGWFWHERENAQVKTLTQLMDSYYKSVGRNGTFLLNFPITPDGLIDTPDSITAAAFGQYVRELFKTDLAKGAKRRTVSVSSSNVISLPQTTLTLKKPATFNRILLQEDITKGQWVKAFRLEALVNGQWQELQDELLPEGEVLTTIGYKRIVCFPTITASKVRLTILDTRHAADSSFFTLHSSLINYIGLFLAPPIVEPQQASLTGGEARPLPTNTWQVLAPSISELEWRKAIDDRDFSIWTMPEGQTSLTIDMRQPQTFSSFTYMPPRRDKNGLILAYQLQVSDDAAEWTTVSEGEFSNIENNPIRQTVPLATPATARYVRLVATRLCQGTSAAIADFKLMK